MRPAPYTGPPPPQRVVTDEEIQPYLDAVADDLDDVGAQQRLASLLWEGGRYDRALNHFERAVQIDPNDARSLLNLGLAYTNLGRLDDADEVYLRLSGRPGSAAIAFQNLGNVAVKKNNIEAAIGFYRRAIEAKPDFTGAHYRLGVVLERSQQYRDAYMSYAKALELEPPESPAGAAEYVDALYRMGRLDLRFGATERAAEMLAEVVAAYPEHPAAYADYGRALEALGRQEEARAALQKHEELKAGS
jgi:superkiller protein 3